MKIYRQFKISNLKRHRKLLRNWVKEWVLQKLLVL